MATLTRGLCVILTLWVVSSRPSAPIRSGSSNSGPWWGTPKSKQLVDEIRTARLAGDLARVESLANEGYEDARRRGDQRAMAGFLSTDAACNIAQFHYRAALESLFKARTCAKRAHDTEQLLGITINLSSVYLQVWDFDSALAAAEEARSIVASLPHAVPLPHLLLQLARIRELRGEGTQETLYRESIEAAHAQGNASLEARGWDYLGEAMLETHRLHEAEAAFNSALKLREDHSPNDRGSSWAWLGALELAKKNFVEAERYNRLAMSAPISSQGGWPEHLLLNQRGQIRMARGQTSSGLDDLREAVNLAGRWRLEVLPATSPLNRSNEELEKKVFDSFIEAEAREAMRTRNSQLIAETLGTVELNRAASLREILALAGVWRSKVPAEYWEVLGRLSALDAQQVRRKNQNDEAAHHDETADRLRLKLTEMEAEVGLGLPANNHEIFRSQTSLIHFQEGLSNNEVLLSIHLGKTDSYLWSVTRNSVRIFKIKGEAEVGEMVRAFRKAVRDGAPEASELGERLYADVFGQLGADAAAKPSWLLSIEGDLFDLPFAALVTERKGGKVVYLVQKHSLQVVPGALLLSRSPGGTKDSWFLGVGDPIYNEADPRWRGDSMGAASPGSNDNWLQFGRLPASAAEVDAIAQSWQRSGSTNAVVLKGADATLARFREFLKRPNGPAVIHLATHVVAPRWKSDQAFVAFGLNSRGQSELLGTRDIAILNVPGALVAMTGCDSGRGDAHPGTGLMGLIRSWQIAGATQVISTAWPMLDSETGIFPDFYKYLRGTVGTAGVSAAEALRRSQVEMIASGTWYSSPSYWASYQVTGGAR